MVAFFLAFFPTYYHHTFSKRKSGPTAPDNAHDPNCNVRFADKGKEDSRSEFDMNAIHDSEFCTVFFLFLFYYSYSLLVDTRETSGDEARKCRAASPTPAHEQC